MVPEEITNAARQGDVDTVREWAATHDVNENTRLQYWWQGANTGGFPLLTLIANSDPRTTDGQLRVGLMLLELGADPNKAKTLSDGSGLPPLHYACRGFSKNSVAMVAALIEAGADVNHKNRSGGEVIAALYLAITNSRYEDRRPHCLKIVRLLLRAGASLDGVYGTDSAEEAFSEMENETRRFNSDDFRLEGSATFPEFLAVRDTLAGVRKAGSYARFVQLPLCKDVLVLRTLALRGRARPTDGVGAFLVTSPNEITWKVLSYWRGGLDL